jgi:hypothetical protein
MLEIFLTDEQRSVLEVSLDVAYDKFSELAAGGNENLTAQFEKQAHQTKKIRQYVSRAHEVIIVTDLEA